MKEHKSIPCQQRTKTIKFSMAREKALEIGLLICGCGHPENNHFMDAHTFTGTGCAFCECKKYDEKAISGVTIV